MLEFLLTSVSSASLVAAGIWLLRAWIEKRLTASIHLETEGRLAKLKSDLDFTNQRIRDLAAVATSANQHVEATLLQHRIEAVKLVWEAVQDWQQITPAAMIVAVLPEGWLKSHTSHKSTKATFEQLLGEIKPNEYLKKQNRALLARPFLSEPAWAAYFALHSFLSSRLIKVMVLTIPGIDHSEVFARINERELVAKSATADILATYDKDPYAATEPYLRHLREEMLREFKEMLSGHRAGNEALKNAAEVVRAAESLSTRSSKNIADLSGPQSD